MSSQQLVWLITGTSSGFGRRLVQSALSRGDLVIASARCLKSIQDLAECPSHQGRVRLLELDVSSGSKNIKHQVDIAVGFFGRIDVLVNNAGHAIPNILEEGGSECLRKQFEVNVFGVIDMANAAAPHMRAQGSGTIVNIGSRSAWKTEIAVGPDFRRRCRCLRSCGFAISCCQTPAVCELTSPLVFFFPGDRSVLCLQGSYSR
ncbi:hypothetical protein HGRIS_013856 [Hohenbuehelia grisea]